MSRYVEVATSCAPNSRKGHAIESVNATRELIRIPLVSRASGTGATAPQANSSNRKIAVSIFSSELRAKGPVHDARANPLKLEARMTDYFFAGSIVIAHAAQMNAACPWKSPTFFGRPR